MLIDPGAISLKENGGLSMLGDIIAAVLLILFVLYVIYSLSNIKYQLRLISKHLNIKEIEIEKVSNEEVEKELNDDSKR